MSDVRHPSSSRRRVVIVDDSLTMSALLDCAFERQGYQVAAIARDPASAAEVIRRERPDLVTIDLCMPYVDGQALLRTLGDLGGVCKIVVSDLAAGNVALAQRLREAGAAACLAKKLLAQDSEAFFRAVTDALRRVTGGRARAGARGAAANDRPAAPGYPIPLDEARRIELVAGKGLADAQPERVFDLLVQQAARSSGFPVAFLSFIDRDRQWLKARHGLDLRQSPRADACCAHTICGDEPLHVRNALYDQRFSRNPFVVGAPYIRTYLGAPVAAADGTRLGALCLADSRPRTVRDEQVRGLSELARLAGEVVDLRPMRAAA